MDAKPDDPTGKLIHYDQHPMGSQGCGFASEQIAAPQTVLRVAEKAEPRGTFRTRSRPVMTAQDTTNHILIDLDAEGYRHLLGNAGTTPGGITPFHLNNGVDYLFLQSFRSRSTTVLG